MCSGKVHSFQTAAHPELFVIAPEVHFGGGIGDAHSLRNFFVVQALVQHDQQLFLSLGQFDHRTLGGVGVGRVGQPFNQFEQDVAHAGGLVDKVVGTGLQALVLHDFIVRKDDQRDLPVGLFDLLHAHHAAGIRQVQFGDHEFDGVMIFNGAFELRYGTDAHDLLFWPDPVNKLCQCVTDKRVVIDDVDGHRSQDTYRSERAEQTLKTYIVHYFL